MQEYEFFEIIGALVSDPKQLLFFDESHRTELTTNRYYGRAKKYEVFFKTF